MSVSNHKTLIKRGFFLFISVQFCHKLTILLLLTALNTKMAQMFLKCLENSQGHPHTTLGFQSFPNDSFSVFDLGIINDHLIDSN